MNINIRKMQYEIKQPDKLITVHCVSLFLILYYMHITDTATIHIR